MSVSLAVEDVIERAREAQEAWSAVAVSERLRIVRDIRHALASVCEDLACAASSPAHPQGEVILSEVLPLLEACRFLERFGARLLAPKPLGARGRPLWLTGVSSVLYREPFGVVAVISPSNYPLFLAGVQILQALVAGNAVVWKPAPGCAEASLRFTRILREAGIPENLLCQLPDTLDAGITLAGSRIDKLVFTGGFRNGTHVLESLSRRAVPAIVELSGSDPVIVCADADLGLVAKALHFGVNLNQGQTCMAPRRVFVPRELLPALESAVKERFSSSPAGPVSSAKTNEAQRLAPLLCDALGRGARLLCGAVGDEAIKGPCILSDVSEDMEVLREELFAPVAFLIPVESEEAAIAGASRGGFALGASVFSSDEDRAKRVSMRLSAGLVSVNDLIVPSADPRVPFGGSGKSGYGVTRGAEGLLSLTRVKVLQVRRRGMTQHLEARDVDPVLAGALARVLHAGGVGAKLSAFVKLCRLACRVAAKVKKSAKSEDSI